MSRKFPQALFLLVFGFICFAIPQHSLAATTAAQSPWPGQPGNPVGHTAWSGWTGSFNTTACGSPSSGSSWSNATVIQNCTYNTAQTINCNYCEFILVDFKAGTSVTQVNGCHIFLFAGDRFSIQRRWGWQRRRHGHLDLFFLRQRNAFSVSTSHCTSRIHVALCRSSSELDLHQRGYECHQRQQWV